MTSALGSGSTGVAPEAARAELDRILASPLFHNSTQLSSFLRFVVESTIEGRADQLKEYVIGVEVLKRGSAFNPREDPVVRVTAGRLRSKLAEYYQSEGRTDAVVIELPRGGYVPVFARLPETGETVGTESGGVRPRYTPQVVLAGLVLAVAACAALWLVPRTQTRSAAIPIPLTSYPGEEVQPAFSPDGTKIAFSWNGNGQDNFDIYVKEIGKDRPVRLTTDSRRDFGPAWSPDGRTIAFGRFLTDVTSAVYTIPVAGGAERKLLESTAPAGFRPRPFVAWSPDGKWLAYSEADQSGPEQAPTGSTPVSLFLISVETGEKRRLTTRPPGAVGDSGPAFAPDGHALVFVRTQTLAISNLYSLALTPDLRPQGQPAPLTSGSVYTTTPSWSPDGREIVFASGKWDRLQLWRVPASGRASPQPLGFSAAHVNDPTVSSRGQLAWSEQSTDINIWRTKLSATGVPERAPARFIASTRLDGNPAWSPDGRRIAFPSDRGGTREIWTCDADGSNPTQLTSMGAPISGSPSWSPDSSKIVFDSNLERQFDLYVIPVSGGSVKRITNSPADESHGRWSPDGSWIYFMSSRSGQRQIWKMPSAGGEAIQVTRTGGVVPFPTADGQYLFYSERAGQGQTNGLGGLRRLRLKDGLDEQILPSITYLNAAIAPEGVWYIPRPEAGSLPVLNFFDLRTHTSRPVIRMTGAVSEGLALSPDGRTLLFTQMDAKISDLMLVADYRRQ